MPPEEMMTTVLSFRSPATRHHRVVAALRVLPLARNARKHRFASQHASDSSLTSLSPATSTYVSFGLAIADRVVRLLPKTLLKSQELVELMW